MHAVLAAPARRRLLELLRADDDPIDAHHLAQATGLHISTARFHLEVLRRAGLVIRSTQTPTGAGRPRTQYRPTSRPPDATGAAAYQQFAALLAAHLDDTSQARAERAEKAGMAWAEQLSIPVNHSGSSIDDAVQHLTSVFADIGFDPEPTTPSTAAREILLHACPFRAVARHHPEVVCAVHLGLLRGTLARMKAATTSQLLPFVEPHLCIAQLGLGAS